MSANKLALNADKSQIMLVTKNSEMKKNFQVVLNGKLIKHKNEVVVLGNTLSSDLSWDAHMRKILIPALTNRARSLRLIAKYLSKGFRAVYANTIYRSKLFFGIKTWGGAKKSLLNRVQKNPRSDLKNHSR